MTTLAKRRNELRLDWRETPERLEAKYKTVIPYGPYILIAGHYYNGPGEPNWFGALYEVTFDEEINPESELGLSAVSAEFFRDAGHAIEWAMNAI